MDEDARAGGFFGMHVVNLPNGNPICRVVLDFWIGHRFSLPIFEDNPVGNLFGFDSPATVTFGFRAGLTDWLSISALRGNRNAEKTIELSAAL